MFRRSASRVTSLLIRKRRVLPWPTSGHAPLGALLLVGGVGLVGGVSGFGAPLVSVLTPPGQTDSYAATARQALSPDDPDDVEPILRQYCMVCHNQTLNTAGLALETLDRLTFGIREGEALIRTARRGQGGFAAELQVLLADQ